MQCLFLQCWHPGAQKLNATLSDEKIQSFNEATNEKISKAFANYGNIFTSTIDEPKDSDLKIPVTGGETLMTKSAFTDDDIPHLNYDRFFAEQVVKYNIKRFIPNSFLAAASRRYLLNRENFLIGLEKIVSNSEVIIVGINIGYQLSELLNKSKFKTVVEYVPATDHQFQDVLFVIRKCDLPAIQYNDVKAKSRQSAHLSLLNDDLKLYASVIDINTPENKAMRNKWPEAEKNSGEDPKVQLTIEFLAVIYWTKNRDVVQLNIASQYKEQGIQNSINEIAALIDCPNREDDASK